jgi:hypothetical protein
VAKVKAEPKQAEVVYIEPVAVRRKTAAAVLDCSETSVWKLEKLGLLDTIKVGADVRITMASIRRFAQGKLKKAA